MKRNLLLLVAMITAMLFFTSFSLLLADKKLGQMLTVANLPKPAPIFIQDELETVNSKERPTSSQMAGASPPCLMQIDQEPYWRWRFFEPEGVVNYFDPEWCGSPTYPFGIDTVWFRVSQASGASYPIDVKIAFFDLLGDSCTGPGGEIYSEIITLPTWGWFRLGLSQTVCVYGPFYGGIFMASHAPEDTLWPNFSQQTLDTCRSWYFNGTSWQNWAQAWGYPPIGNVVFRVIGFVQHPDCPPGCQWVSFDGSPPQTPAEVEVTQCDPQLTILRFVVHGMCVEDTMVGTETFQILSVPGMTSTGNLGRPGLPAMHKLMGLPTLAESVSVTAIPTSPLTFTGLNIFPLQIDPNTPPPGDTLLVKDTSFYSDSNYFSPSVVAKSGRVNLWHILPTANVGIFPFQYNPVTDLLIAYDTIYVTLFYPGPPVTDTIPRSFIVLYKSLANSECIFTIVPQNINEFEPHKLFIVVDTLYNDSCVAKLIRWERKKGFNVTKMRVTEAGGSPATADSIKKTIRAFYGKPECHDKPKYVVLIGEHPEVPAKVAEFDLGLVIVNLSGGTDWDILSDEWYELMGEEGEDFIPDLFLGRLPTNDPDTICKIINIKIENDSTAHDYITKELFVAHRQNRRRDRGDGIEADFCFMANKQMIEGFFSDCGWEVTEVYGALGGRNADVKTAIEDGLGEVNYRGHGSFNSWKEWDAMGDYWDNSDVGDLDVTGKEPIVWSLSCYNNKIDEAVGNCIGEKWVKAGKAIAHFGSSRSSTSTINPYLDRFIYEAICEFDEDDETADLGQIINRAKVNVAGEFDPGGEGRNNDYAKLTILEFLLLGDPEQTKWTDLPEIPWIDHPADILDGPQLFTVSVAVGSIPEEAAIVSLWKEGLKGDEVFEAKYTGTSGQATFNINPQTKGIMYVTVWGKNLKVYLGEVSVYLRGDANGDGVMNSADVVYLINYLFKNGPAPEPLEAGDVNCDGIINSADVVYLINYLYKSGPAPGC